MKKPMLTLVIIIMAISSSFAQNQITGKISDNKNAIYFATVVLYNKADSTIYKAESSDENGKYKIKGIKDGNYYLETSMIGYISDRIDEVNFPEKNNQEFDFTLKTDSKILNEIEVVARKPLLEQKSDRLIVNVENNITSLNGSVLDVMKKVPGMIVVGDKLSMAGQSNMTILINGKTTKYMDVQSLLKDMPGDNIKKVEVITQPGAEFDAEGTGPVLNIILKKNSLFGTNGNVSLGVGKGQYWKYKTGLSLSHYQGNFNVHGSLGYRRNSWWDELDITRIVGEDTYSQISDDPSLSGSFRANLSMDWDITDKHRTGISGRVIDSKGDYTITNTTLVNFGDPTLTDWKLESDNLQDDGWKLLTINPYYTFTIDTSGQKIDFDFSVVRIDIDNMNTLETTELNEGQPFPSLRNIQIGATDIFTTQLDYTLPVSDDLKIQIGTKYSDASLDNNLQSLYDESGAWENNIGQSNHFLFDETIAAAYSKVTWRKNKWNGTAGLRYEDSDSKGYSITIDSTITRDIAKFFPSASIGRSITKDLGATFAYSYRIDRPRYNNLNPFKYFLDQYTFEKGNENLAPALTHSLKFNLHYENQPFFNIEYKHTKDAIVELAEQNDAEGTSNLVTVNLENFKNFNASLFFPLDFIPKLSGYGAFIANYGLYDSEYLGENFKRDKWDFTGYISAEFELPGKINTEISGWYNSGGQDGITNADWLYGVDVGMSKKFMDGKARVSLGVENLFARYLTAEIIYSNMNIDVRNRWDGPVVNMQFTYKFGNQHMKKKGHNNSAQDVLNRAGK